MPPAPPPGASAAALRQRLRRRYPAFQAAVAALGPEYLGLLPFFLNHRRFLRSEHPGRVGKGPAELLTGRPHAHWLELLGYTRFARGQGPGGARGAPAPVGGPLRVHSVTLTTKFSSGAGWKEVMPRKAVLPAPSAATAGSAMLFLWNRTPTPLFSFDFLLA